MKLSKSGATTVLYPTYTTCGSPRFPQARSRSRGIDLRGQFMNLMLIGLLAGRLLVFARHDAESAPEPNLWRLYPRQG
jgi:hypothetical protein